jgi:hypothetical protein
MDGHAKTVITLGVVGVDAAKGLILFGLMFTAAQVWSGQGDYTAPLLTGAWERGGEILMGIVLGIPMANATGRIKLGERTLENYYAFALGMIPRHLISCPIDRYYPSHLLSTISFIANERILAFDIERAINSGIGNEGGKVPGNTGAMIRNEVIAMVEPKKFLMTISSIVIEQQMNIGFSQVGDA